MPTTSRANLRGIVRIANSPNHKPGWQVKIRRQGEQHHRYFADADYGGKRASLRAAIRHRNKIVKQLPLLTRRERSNIPMKTNSSGIVGVYRRIKAVRRGRRRWDYAVWTASGSPRPHERKVKDFYVHMWGERVAKFLAIEQREKWEREMDRY